uniref:Right handed beta helix domain-containing protein n=1 Tax=Musca domestica TaxID=7370 RepID=A0A1I8MBC7_MUSDO
MIRPQKLSFSPQTKTTTMWVIVQFCLLFLATTIPPAYCDKDFTTTTTTPSHGINNNNISNNDKLLHRVARLTKVDYSLLKDETNRTNSNNPIIAGSGGAAAAIAYPYSAPPGGYLASNGLRTLLKPQKFYTKQQRFSSDKKNPNLVSLNLVTEPRKNICDGHCQCEKQNSFTTVTCDFKKNPKLSSTFDKTFKMPELAKILVVKLGPRTQFNLREGFFHNDTINRFIVEGNMEEPEKVEIGTDAFRGNNGPFPEIVFSNVFTIVILQRAFRQKASESCKLNVTNSNNVLLFENAFENTQIRGTFVGIKDLRIAEKAFSSAQAKLHIESSHIDNLYRFDASIREIKFVKCSIGTINPGAFDVNQINSIIFESCRIDAIKSRAITEKLLSEHVSITGATIGIIERDAIYGSGIKELKISNNKIDYIYENAIYVTSIYVTITDNHIKHLGSNWLHVKDWTRIKVERNQFGIFGHIQLEKSRSSEKCTFGENSLTSPQDGSLNFTNPHCNVYDISLNKPCRCDFHWLERLSDHDLKSQVFCTIDEKLGNCFNATMLNFLQYYSEVCDDSKTILDCKNKKNLRKIEGRFFTAEELAAKNNRLPELIAIVVSATVISIVIFTAIIIMICRCRRRSLKMSRGGGGAGGDANQGRSHVHEFSSDDRLTIQQSLQLIQKKYPEIYKKIHEKIQIMFVADLSETKCVKTTSQIVNLLNKVQNPGTDFMALNRVLTEHLQSPLPSAPPADQTPIYSEPGLTEGDFYAANTFDNLQGNPMMGSAAGATGPEHIYAEPSCVQQPLLPNEYASPADGHLESMDVYTEPVNERDSNPTTAYAVTQPLNRPMAGVGSYQSPYRLYATPMRSTQYSHQQRQLPDVLSQHNTQQRTTAGPISSPTPSSSSSTANLSNVQRIVQNLQDKNNFNPIAKPRNMHFVAPPQYTAPSTGIPVATAALSQRPAASEDIELDLRGATALPNDSGSNHSGGSNETVQIDDVILYADS